MTPPAARFTENTRIAGWMSALLATATYSYLQEAYFRLPIVVPVSFEDGNPDQFAIKSPALVFLPFGLQLALGVIFAAVAWILVGRARTERTPALRAGAQHTAEGVALLATVWIAFQGVNAWRLIGLWRRTYDAHIELYVFALVTAVTLSVLIGARVLLKVNELGPTEQVQHTVLRDRSPLATAVLAAVLAVGIGTPLYLLSVVWSALHPI